VTAAPALVPEPLGPIPPDDPRAVAYSHGGYAIALALMLWSVTVLVVLVRGRAGPLLQAIAERATRRVNLQVALCAGAFAVITFLAALPLRAWWGFARERAYGFGTQTFASWLGDQGKRLVLDALLQALIVTALYAILRRLGHRGWIAGSAFAILALVVLQAVYPVFITPLFNRFEPLKDPALRADILALARAQGIPADEVYQMDASRRTAHTNAYVAGMLGTQRIVLYDTLLQRYAPREILCTMGHEMGHYVLHHIAKFTIFLSVLIAGAFLLVDRLARRLIAARPGLGVRRLEEPASLPLLALLLSVAALIALPVINAASRRQESQADLFELSVVNDPAASASSFRKFGTFDLEEYRVNPWIETLLFTHPSPEHRIETARDYAREHGLMPEHDAK
jgi:STE24 endopeptidase